MCPVSFLLSIMINVKLGSVKTPLGNDLYKQEEDQFKEMGIDLKKYADLNKIESFDIPTSLNPIKAIRWTNNHKKIVIFVHGVLCDKFTASKTVKLWNDNGYDVVSFDGYGWGETREYGWKTKFSKRNAILLNDVVKFVCKKYKVEKVILHGESMGGGTVYRYLEKYDYKNIERVLVDAGFLSFRKSLKYAVYSDVNKFVYWVSMPTMWIVLAFSGYPVLKNIKKKTLATLPFPLLHIQSKKDAKVQYEYFEAEEKYFTNNSYYRLYKNKVRHVRGYYDSPKELEAFVKELVNKK